MNEFLHWEPGEEPPDLNTAEATERLASRVVLIDNQQRVLLLKWLRPDGAAVWITPGGALETGESFEEAAVRELWEETGLRDVVVGEQVWQSSNFFSVQGDLYHSVHRFFVARVGPVTISNKNMDELERAVNGEHRWWSLEELLASDQIRPPGLVGILAPIIEACVTPAAESSLPVKGPISDRPATEA